MTIVGNSVEIPLNFEVELDRPAYTVGPGPHELVRAGRHRVTMMRHWAVTLADGVPRAGATWFRIDLDGHPVWVRAADCPPYTG
jgi:hypothetical protein